MGVMMWPEAVPEAEGRGHRPRAYFFLQSSILNARGRRPRAFFFKVILILTRSLFIQLAEYFFNEFFSKNTLLVEQIIPSVNFKLQKNF